MATATWLGMVAPNFVVDAPSLEAGCGLGPASRNLRVGQTPAGDDYFVQGRLAIGAQMGTTVIIHICIHYSRMPASGRQIICPKDPTLLRRLLKPFIW